jgi:hypothetical protein
VKEGRVDPGSKDPVVQLDFFHFLAADIKDS